MSKDKISEYSATANSNTDIAGINIDEGCAPSGINNAIRTLMSHIKDLQAGTSGDTIPITAGGTGSTTAADALIALGERTGATGSTKIATGTTGQRDGSPSAGYFRFNSTTTKFEGYNGSAWGSVGGGATGGGNDEVFVENSQTVTTNYTLTSGKSASSAGPITINSGVTVTIPDGSRWVVL
jgi:hypothetical protein